MNIEDSEETGSTRELRELGCTGESRVDGTGELGRKSKWGGGRGLIRFNREVPWKEV